MNALFAITAALPAAIASGIAWVAAHTRRHATEPDAAEQLESTAAGESGWYDRDGRPITRRQVEILASDRAYKKVAVYDEVPDHLVSTVWIGLDQDLYPPTAHGFPAVFETVIFADDGEDGGSVWSQTYSSEVAALAGHDQAVMRLRHEILGLPVREWSL